MRILLVLYLSALLSAIQLCLNPVSILFAQEIDVVQEDDAVQYNELYTLPGLATPVPSDDSDPAYTKEDLIRDLNALKNRLGKAKRTRELIQKLNSDHFEERRHAEKELTIDPDISLDELLRAAKNDPSFEIRFRIKRILEVSSIGTQVIAREKRHAAIVASLNSNAMRQHKEIRKLLFDTAEFLGTTELIESAAAFVFDTSEKADLDGLRKNLEQNDNAKVLAIYGLGKMGVSQDLLSLRRLMKDRNKMVSLAAAYMLARRNDREALAELINNLSNQDQHVRVKSTQILRGWTGIQHGFNPYIEPGSQINKITDWRSWYVYRSNKTKLNSDFQLAVLPEDLNHGLLVHYSFDKFVIGKFQNLVDKRFSGLSRNSVDFVMRGTSKAIRFHGAGKHGSRGGHALIDPVKFHSLKEFTIALWVKETGMIHDEGEAYISFGIDGGVGRDDSLGIAHFNGLVIYRTGRGEVTVPFDMDDRDKWVHYAMTFKKDVIIAYKDGKMVGRSPGKINVKSTRAALARHWWGNGVGTSTRIQAAMDDVRIYKRALMPGQIKYLVDTTRE